MTRQVAIRGIIESFNECARELKEQKSALFCDISSDFYDGVLEENIKHHYAKIYFSSYIIVFKYTAHGTLSIVNSILECFISLDKSEEAILYPVTGVLDFLDIDTLDCYAIPLITNGKVMRECFFQIADSLFKYQPQIRDLSYDDERKIDLYRYFVRQIEIAYKTKINTEADELRFFLSSYYKFITDRTTSAPYLLHMSGNYLKAARKFDKIKVKSGYEERLIPLLKSSHGSNEMMVPLAILNNISTYNSMGVSKANFKEFIAIFSAGFLWAIIYGFFFTAFFFMLFYMEKLNTIYLMGPLTNAPMLFLPSFIMGIIASYFSRHKAYKFFFRKDYEKITEMDYISNSVATDKFMRGFSVVLLICSIVFVVLLVKWNIKFAENGFTDNTKFFAVSADYYPYSQVKRVYYKAERINGFGDILNSPSYVLVLEDGREIDFFEFEEAHISAQKIIPHLREKGVEVNH